MGWGILFRTRQYVLGSLGLAPLLGALLGLVLAEVSVAVEASGATPGLWHYTPETATAVLSSTIGAVASLTGFVVTVTVLGVQMATGTFSPRYMRLWYRDRLLKGVLAVLLGTLLFAFSIIRRISADFVPNGSVTLSSLGVAVSVLLFMLYLDRFIHRMRPVAVAALMAEQGRRAFLGSLVEAGRPDTSFVPHGSLRLTSTPTYVLRAEKAGTIQAVDARGLTRFARQNECLLVFRHAVGDFVSVDAVILEVHGAELSEGIARRLRDLVALGVERTIEQDPAFAIRVMVDVATRALSPAVNDPTTAVQVLDHLAETLRMFGTAPDPASLAMGPAPTTGVVMPIRSWPEILSLGVTEIREYGGTSIQVLRRLRALLEELGQLVKPERKVAVDDELRRLAQTVAVGFGGRVDLDRATMADAQGLGGPGPGPTRDAAVTAA
jgi:uncharacterized membrane protein